MMKYFHIEPICDEKGDPLYKALCATDDSESRINEIIFSVEGTEEYRASIALATDLPLVVCGGYKKKPLGDITFYPWFDMLLSERAFALLNERLRSFGSFYPIQVVSSAKKRVTPPSGCLHLSGLKVWTVGTLRDAENQRWPIFVQSNSPYRTLIREDVVKKMVDSQLTGFVSIPVSERKPAG